MNQMEANTARLTKPSMGNDPLNLPVATNRIHPSPMATQSQPPTLGTTEDNRVGEISEATDCVDLAAATTATSMDTRKKIANTN
jgi:hypothetical protein